MFIDFLYDALSTQLEVFGVVNLSIWVLITSAYIQIVSFDYFLYIWLGTWKYSKMAKINIDINLDTFCLQLLLHTVYHMRLVYPFSILKL